MGSTQLDEPIFEYVRGDGPLLISFPHSGTFVPSALRGRLRSDALDLPDTDWFVPQLYDFFRSLGASIIRATHSRYVVDLNRPPDGAPLYVGQRETTVCPTESFDGEALYHEGATPTRDEIGERLRAYWRPYHDELASLVGERVRCHGHCILWDAHSIRSRVPGLFDGLLPDLNVGSVDGRSCSRGLVDRIIEALRAQNRFSFVIDGRFKGGYITRRYGHPGHGVHAVQMEIAQCAYLREARVPAFDAHRAAPLTALLRDLLGRAAGFDGAPPAVAAQALS